MQLYTCYDTLLYATLFQRFLTSKNLNHGYHTYFWDIMILLITNLGTNWSLLTVPTQVRTSCWRTEFPRAEVAPCTGNEPVVAPYLSNWCFWVPAVVLCVAYTSIRVKGIIVYTVGWRDNTSINKFSRIQPWNTWKPILCYIESVTILSRKLFIVITPRVFCGKDAFGACLFY